MVELYVWSCMLSMFMVSTVEIGDVLNSKRSQFVVQEILNEGMFNVVTRCRELQTSETVMAEVFFTTVLNFNKTKYGCSAFRLEDVSSKTILRLKPVSLSVLHRPSCETTSIPVIQSITLFL